MATKKTAVKQNPKPLAILVEEIKERSKEKLTNVGISQRMGQKDQYITQALYHENNGRQMSKAIINRVEVEFEYELTGLKTKSGKLPRIVRDLEERILECEMYIKLLVNVVAELKSPENPKYYVDQIQEAQKEKFDAALARKNGV